MNISCLTMQHVAYQQLVHSTTTAVIDPLLRLTTVMTKSLCDTWCDLCRCVFHISLNWSFGSGTGVGVQNSTGHFLRRPQAPPLRLADDRVWPLISCKPGQMGHFALYFTGKTSRGHAPVKGVKPSSPSNLKNSMSSLSPPPPSEYLT
jgi:hypothetical protein